MDSSTSIILEGYEDIKVLEDDDILVDIVNRLAERLCNPADEKEITSTTATVTPIVYKVDRLKEALKRIIKRYMEDINTMTTYNELTDELNDQLTEDNQLLHDEIDKLKNENLLLTNDLNDTRLHLHNLELSIDILNNEMQDLRQQDKILRKNIEDLKKSNKIYEDRVNKLNEENKNLRDKLKKQSEKDGDIREKKDKEYPLDCLSETQQSQNGQNLLEKEELSNDLKALISPLKLRNPIRISNICLWKKLNNITSIVDDSISNEKALINYGLNHEFNQGYDNINDHLKGSFSTKDGILRVEIGKCSSSLENFTKSIEYAKSVLSSHDLFQPNHAQYQVDHAQYQSDNTKSQSDYHELSQQQNSQAYQGISQSMYKDIEGNLDYHREKLNRIVMPRLDNIVKTHSLHGSDFIVPSVAKALHFTISIFGYFLTIKDKMVMVKNVLLEV